jgi:hypothetical protein
MAKGHATAPHDRKTLSIPTPPSALLPTPLFSLPFQGSAAQADLLHPHFSFGDEEF